MFNNAASLCARERYSTADAPFLQGTLHCSFSKINSTVESWTLRIGGAWCYETGGRLAVIS
jgi:hypothetical protein